MSTEDKLEPCPFCGGRAELHAATDSDDEIYVQCWECDSESQHFNSSEEFAFDEAIAAWNRRTPASLSAAAPTPANLSARDEALEELVAELENMADEVVETAKSQAFDYAYDEATHDSYAKDGDRQATTLRKAIRALRTAPASTTLARLTTPLRLQRW